MEQKGVVMVMEEAGRGEGASPGYGVAGAGHSAWRKPGAKWLMSTGMGLDDFWFAPGAPGGAQARDVRRKSRPSAPFWRPGARCSEKVTLSLFLIVFGVPGVRFGRFLSRFGGFGPFRNCW
ncbi:hypothetical protein LR48_Vigan232s000900 [Vigna angularis]|uniref:Uncharacterized protein n=1 Tax=Phaseolus angularis TaxID=3914 RepID=A0A0L9T6B1_PHAAN|nr:hypothetical protein LR48_Vigan232s000900 [Vigna angularis]